MEHKHKRGSWSSGVAFVMAAAGSAIGLGNLWGFPYKLGAGGGAIFLLFYLFFVVTVGVVSMLGEITLGRKTGMSAVTAYGTFGKKYKILGYMGIVCGFVILSFYSVVASWSIKYFVTYLGKTVGLVQMESAEVFFNSFTSNGLEVIFYHLIVMAITIAIVMAGVQKGIDKTTSVLMPALFVMLVLLAIRSLTLPGAVDGLKFMFMPNLETVKEVGLGKIMTSALSQVFFSLSVGMGTMLTYGSYLDKKTNLVKASMMIPIMDTAAAILAGLVIMPAVFAYDLSPTQGPPLLFIVMSQVFNSMPMGDILGAVFYLLIIFAAITSTISILELITSFFVDEKKKDRKKSALISGIVIALCGIPVALSFGILKDVRLPALNGDWLEILGWYDYVSEYVLMTLGALIMCLLIGWVWKPKAVIDEIKISSEFKLEKVWSFLIKYVTPVLIFVTFLTSAGFIKV